MVTPMSLRTRLSAAVVAAALVAPTTLHADPPSLGAWVTSSVYVAPYSKVTVSFLYSLAANNNRLYALTTPSSGGPGLSLMYIGGGTGVGAPSSFTFDWIAGTEVVFGLCSTIWGSPEIPCPKGGLSGESIEDFFQFEKMYFTGAASRNWDRKLHAAFLTSAEWNGLGYGNTAAAGSTVIGFEDLKFQGDKDFNDVVFSVSSVPEPASMALLATGLVGLGVAGVIRRRKKPGVPT